MLIGAIFALVATASFAQIAFGISGALHMDTRPDERFMDNFDRLAWYGGFGELYLGEFGIGLGFNFQKWNDELLATEFINYDFTLYGQYHLFGATAFLDPFAEAGIGLMGYDFANEIDDPNTEAPIAASAYGYLGLGLGVNLGSIGGFAKFQFNYANDQPVEVEDEFGNPVEVPAFYVFNYRFTLGVKIIL
jgi:hypothetical protein